MRLSNIIQSVFSVTTLLSIPTAVTAADSNSTSNSTTPAITIDGNAFYNSDTNERFYIRGVDYQPGGSSNLTDPLADVDVCGRDVPVFKDLGINTVRVYTVDNSLDHSECMKLLSDAGIYLILDVNTPKSAISRLNPSCSYNADYLQNVFATIDAFAEYDNVLGFFAGNEVINSDNTTSTATYVKAVVRDMKKYIKARNYRTIPVGYSAADIVANRQLSAEYFNCGDDADARIDMFGVNDYSWCGQSSFGVSGYATKMQLYKNYSIPIFLSEFGCNKVVSNRPFTEIESIYSTQMSSVFSGGLVYEYSNETNNYGLVKIDSDGTNVTKLPDYENLKSEYAKVTNPTGDGGAYNGNDYSTCPDYEEGTWEANNTLPDMPTAASAYFKSGAGEPMGTFISTQNSCYDDDDDDIASLSSSSSVESTSSSSVESTSTSSTTTMSSSTLASSTSSSRSSSSKGVAGTLEVPTIFQLLSQGLGYLL
ncbi:similar to Saccharomyces cerevisiae YOL030W GAS5 1,3-beta-glucanosyltransferase, has similarity to Gas1p [Maudiozyma saulgeensis]|uniref:1,3-beta-glucanosyltransferase n=1 Tax=Maudiozyma saulgeensis TaxID=1789683 RepID=A0A1X7R779_9SACH|nr:similar to Saccharomyces cerevisiae YOL030W GAS5 1,3-beta-glucanosyltransferase, has similarity to Gas1p [Kazachstania saulgeensis]